MIKKTALRLAVVLLLSVSSSSLPAQKSPGPEVEEKAVPRKEISVDPALFDTYAGKYQLAPGIIVDIFREDDRLMTQITGQPKFQLFPESTTRFFLKVVDAQVTFDPDQKKITIHQNGRDVTAQRVEASPSKSDIGQFAGDYYSDELMVTYHVLIKENSLYLKIGYRPEQELRPAGEDLFNAGFLMHFRRDAKKEVIGLDVNAGRVQNLKCIRQNLNDHF
jgi:hypothetical protein